MDISTPHTCDLCGHTTTPEEVECDSCGLDPICAVLNYADPESGVPEGILLRRQRVQRGDTLYRQGAAFTSFFAVKSGSFKSYMAHSDGEDQIVGFHLAGELIGTEGIASGRYPSTVRALEAGSVCELYLERLPESGKTIEVLQDAIIRLLGEEVAFNRGVITSLVHQSAEERIAGFLKSTHDRLQFRKLAADEFVLSMSRSDIGNYLGLAGETVSRLLTKLQKLGVIMINRKRVRILDLPGLTHLAGEDD